NSDGGIACPGSPLLLVAAHAGEQGFEAGGAAQAVPVVGQVEVAQGEGVDALLDRLALDEGFEAGEGGVEIAEGGAAEREGEGVGGVVALGAVDVGQLEARGG